MDERQQRRIDANAARYREMNERTRERVDQFDGAALTYSLMCECALARCEDMMEIRRPDYERVRAQPRWFMVLPDHVLPGADQVIEQYDSFWIVNKVQQAGGEAPTIYNVPDGGD